METARFIPTPIISLLLILVPQIKPGPQLPQAPAADWLPTPTSWVSNGTPTKAPLPSSVPKYSILTFQPLTPFKKKSRLLSLKDKDQQDRQLDQLSSLVHLQVLCSTSKSVSFTPSLMSSSNLPKLQFHPTSTTLAQERVFLPCPTRPATSLKKLRISTFSTQLLREIIQNQQEPPRLGTRNIWDSPTRDTPFTDLKDSPSPAPWPITRAPPPSPSTLPSTPLTATPLTPSTPTQPTSSSKPTSSQSTLVPFALLQQPTLHLSPSSTNEERSVSSLSQLKVSNNSSNNGQFEVSVL